MTLAFLHNLRLHASILAVVTATVTMAVAQPAPRPVAPPAPPPYAKAPTKIQWESSFEAALAKAKATGKPVMVSFTSGWCVACHYLDTTVYTNSRVAAESANFINVRVDSDREERIARRYGVQVMPSIVWLDSSGKMIYGLEGAPTASELVPEMQTALELFQHVASSSNTATVVANTTR